MRKSECITAVRVLPAASTGEASAVESATTDSASVEANARGPRRMKWNIESSPDVKLFKGGLLIEHEVRSLGELTSCNAFIFSRLADSAERVNPVSLQALAAHARAP
nr:hypothetical protein BDOA9_0154710 [Bradyrhizobium sp. DOA9]